MKKLMSVLLTFLLIFSISVSAAEDQGDQKDEKEDPSYTIPVGVGILYSVMIYKDSVSVVFSPVTNKAAVLGLKTLDSLVDVKEIRLLFKEGDPVVLPAVIEMKSYDVGTFISLNLSLKTIAAVSDLFAVQSAPEKVAFVHRDGTEQEMSLVELNQALSDVFGSTVDIAARAGKATAVFLKNLASGVWIFAENTSASVGKALSDAGHWISEAFSSAGQSVNELKEKTGGFLKNAVQSVKDFWRDLWAGLNYTVLRLWLY